MSQPFLSFFTPTYKRPKQLAACLQSVGAQTLVNEIEQIVIPDHIGVGVDGMFARVPLYAQATRGQYVHLLADDDVLAGPTVVEQLKRLAEEHDYPDVLIVRVRKGWMDLPMQQPGPPLCGHIDLGCCVTRGDVWRANAHRYGVRYEGDFDFMDALYQAGHRFVWTDLFFMTGGVSHGAAE